MVGNEYKLPPQNIEAEQSVLGGLLIDNEKISVVKGILVADDFYRDAHRKIFIAIVDLDDKSVNVDLVTLTDELRKGNQLDSIGGASYLASIIDATPTSENVEYHARIVKEKSVRRKIIETCTDSITAAYGGNEETNDIVGALYIASQELTEKSATGKKLERMKISDVEKLISLRETPYKRLNYAIGGFLGKEVIAVGGSKGSGKTSFVSGLFIYTAMVEKRPAVYYGTAMSKEIFKLRLLSMQSRIPFDVLIKGNVFKEPTAKEKLLDAQKALNGIEIYHSAEAEELNIVSAAAEIKALKRRVGDLGMVIIENLGELTLPGKFNNRFEKMIKIATILTGLADDLNAPVVISCQIGKETDWRENRRPILSDLKDAGAVGEKASKAFLLYRPAYYDPKTSVPGSEQQTDPEIGEIIIAKGGPPMIIPHYFDGATRRWWDKDD